MTNYYQLLHQTVSQPCRIKWTFLNLYLRVLSLKYNAVSPNHFIFLTEGRLHFPDLFKTAQKKMFHMLPKA